MPRPGGPALAVLAVLALALGAWLLARPTPRASPEPAPAAAASPSATARPSELLATAPLAPLAGAADGTPAGAPRESAAESVPHGPVRGRLVDEESGAPLAEERVVLLATPGNRIAETLRSGADGRFESTRRFPRGTLRAFVTQPGTGERLCRHEAEFDPEAAGEWRVPVPAPRAQVHAAAERELDPFETSLRGEVVDLQGRPVPDVVVKLIPLEAGGELRSDSTDPSGAFELEPLVPGVHRLLVHGNFTSTAPESLVIAAGPNERGRIVLPIPPGGGALRGSLLLGEHEESLYFLRLRDPASGKQIAGSSDWKLFDEDDGVVDFELAAIPAGDYELSVVAFDGLAFEPSVMRVSPPADGLKFRASREPRRRCLVRVVDARSGAELEDFTTMLRIHGQWIGGEGSPTDDFEFFSAAWDPWIFFTAAHRPARSGPGRARRVPCDDEFECFEFTVELQGGFGGALLFKDVESDRLVAPGAEDPYLSPGLAGVRVLADGALAATSDADGLALLDLPGRPRSVTYEHPGWRVVGEEDEDDIRWVYLVRE
jgi:hypothetical protein